MPHFDHRRTWLFRCCSLTLFYLAVCSAGKHKEALIDRVEHEWAEALLRADRRGDWQDMVGPVDAHCKFRYRFGLSLDAETRGPALSLSFRGGRSFEASPHAPRDAEFDAMPALCIYDGLDSPAGDAETPVHLMVTNSLEYLFRQWPLFVNRVLFANAAKMRVAIYVGELPAALATTVGRSCAASRQGREGHGCPMCHRPTIVEDRSLRSVYYDRADGLNGTNSNHHNKMIGASLLLSHPRVGGVFYDDLDAFYDIEALQSPLWHRRIHDAQRWDVAFGFWKENPFWLVKGGRFYVRDSSLGHQMMGTWISFRCGFKDQWSLWHSILTLAKNNGCIEYSDELLDVVSYDAMKRGRQLWPHLDVTAADLNARCPAFRYTTSTEIEQPWHKSVTPDRVLRFPYVEERREYVVDVTNLSDDVEGEDDSAAKRRYFSTLTLDTLVPTRLN